MAGQQGEVLASLAWYEKDLSDFELDDENFTEDGEQTCAIGRHCFLS